MNENNNNKSENKEFWISGSIILTVLLWSLFPWVMLAISVKNKTNSWIKAFLTAILSLVMTFSLYTATDEGSNTRINYLESQLTKLENENEKLKTENIILTNETTPEIVETNSKNDTTPTPTKESKKIEEYTFGSGNYTCSVDFLPGKYDLIAIEGSSGNVITSHLRGGVNEIMGLEKEWATKEIKNITFVAGESIEIRGIKIKLIPVVE